MELAPREDPAQTTIQGDHTRTREVSRKMPLDQLASLLVEHGVKDITDKVDLERRSSEPLERGGFGSIFRGELQDGYLVAIKQCNQDLGEKHCKHAAHELYTWSKCDHPGVLKVLGFALNEGSLLLISPWVPNGSLAGHLMRDKPCDRLETCIALAGTVEYLHNKGIIHGDIKTDNILVSDNGDTQLMDFGNASLVKYLTLSFTHTSRQLPCSIRFTAPEILDETSENFTTKSDIYALGMTIYQILTGKRPYADHSHMRALADIFRGIPPTRPGFDDILHDQLIQDKLWSLLERCWKLDPNDRPAAIEVKDSLIQIRDESRASSRSFNLNVNHTLL